MDKSLLKKLISSVPSQKIIDCYSSDNFTGVETQDGPGIAMTIPGENSKLMACVNAYYNQGNKYFEPFENYCTRGLDFYGKTVGVIGHMTGISKRYSDIAKKIYIFELDPKEGDYPASMEDELLPSCDIVVITGCAVINETVDHILELSKDAYKILLGVSVPMNKDLLDYGFDRLSGMVVSDVEKMRTHIKSNLPGSPYYYGTPFLISK